MKALTIPQPSATLVALGITKIEPWPWYTAYRGPLAIHAAEVYPQWAKDRARHEPFRTLLRNAGFRHWSDLPTGAVIAVCQLADCRLIVAPSDEPEASFGTYTPGYYAWHLSGVRQLPKPVPARDAFGLWDWRVPPDLVEMLGEGESGIQPGDMAVKTLTIDGKLGSAREDETILAAHEVVP